MDTFSLSRADQSSREGSDAALQNVLDAGLQDASSREALDAFDFGAPVKDVVRYGAGHINDTFLVLAGTSGSRARRFILQRMSATAFRHPRELMNNIVHVTEYLKKQIARVGGDPARECLTVIRTKDGAPFYEDSRRNAWRVFAYVDGTVCYQSADSPELFAASGWAFGHFQKMLADYPAHTLFETIPDFHNTPKRLEHLRKVAKKDSFARAAHCQKEMAFALSREADCAVALQAQKEGILPLRVTHNDTKLNNVLFDAQTGKAICVIDLDTVMPGLSIYDFGDSIRFGANHCAEDETDLSRVSLDLELFAAYAQAFLEGASGTLTDAEVRYLPWGARLMTLECGIRFLADYLEGDIYFHTERPGQNLDRARTQFKLVTDMERHWGELLDML